MSKTPLLDQMLPATCAQVIGPSLPNDCARRWPMPEAISKGLLLAIIIAVFGSIGFILIRRLFK